MSSSYDMFLVIVMFSSTLCFLFSHNWCVLWLTLSVWEIITTLMLTKNLLQSQSSICICWNIPRSSSVCFELFFAVICLSTSLPSFPSFSQPGKDSNAEAGPAWICLGDDTGACCWAGIAWGEPFWIMASMSTHDIAVFSPYLIVWKNTVKTETFVWTRMPLLKIMVA